MMDTVANTFPVITQTKKTTNQPTEQSFTKVRKKLRKILLHKKFEDLNPLLYSKDDGSYPEK